MSEIPWAEHSACHTAHVRVWPVHARVWVRWGSMGWRPGVVRGHRDTRVGVQVIDGLWPFDGSRLSGRPTRMTWKAPSSLRARRNDTRPTEHANTAPGCVVLVAHLRRKGVA